MESAKRHSVPSPVFYRDRLYLVRAGGLLTCVNADHGAVIYRERLGAMGHYSPSPVIANGHLYLVSSRGTIAVVKTGDEFQIVHQAKLDEAVPATSAMNEGTLYVRTEKALLAFR